MHSSASKKKADHLKNVEHSQLPCIMWLTAYKPKRFSLSWIANWVSSHFVYILESTRKRFMFLVVLQICIVLGVLLMVLSPIGGLRSIILSAKSYQFFS